MPFVADSFESQDWVRVGVASALAKEFTADQKRFLALFAKVLQEAFPQETRVQTKGLFTKTVVAVEVTLGEDRYRIADAGSGPLEAGRVRVVRGIALKTEPISMETCLNEISEAMEERARKSANDRLAMARLLGLD